MGAEMEAEREGRSKDRQVGLSLAEQRCPFIARLLLRGVQARTMDVGAPHLAGWRAQGISPPIPTGDLRLFILRCPIGM